MNALWRERSGGRAGLSRGLAGVLPPAGQIFERWCVLKICVNFGDFFVPFKQGSSKGAASGGSDF